MPYIKKDRRTAMRAGEPPTSVGELNYAFAMLVKDYLGDCPNYQFYNDVIGALECCKLEIYRRLASPYEDEKIKLNGDVF